MKLSQNARNALRNAITNHPRWDRAFRAANNYSLATMSRADYFQAAEKLGLNISQIIREADNAPAQPTNPKVEEAKDIFEDEAQDTPRPVKVDDEFRARSERNAQEAKRVLDQDDKAGKLLRLISELAGNQIDVDQVRSIVREEMENAPTANNGIVRIELKYDGKTIRTVEGRQHPQMAKMLKVATARDAKGYVPNMWVAGPAGSGKTYAAETVAKALEIPFHFNGAIGMSHELLGFIDGNGFYHRTAFREAYENGGVYLFDEVDGSDNAALLALNAALANGQASFPDGVVKRHVDCIIICCANTWGAGATAEYVGRSKLDAAFLDRFPVKFFWDYDNELEQAICGHAAFAQKVQRARAKAQQAGLKVLISPRTTMAGAALIAAGFTEYEAAEMTYLAPLKPEQRNLID